MVGELQQLGCEGRAAGEERRLGRRLDVAGEEDARLLALDAHAEHEGAVVVAEAAGRLAPGRPERLDAEIAGGEGGIARAVLLEGDAATARHFDQRREARLGEAARGQPEPGHAQRLEHTHEAAAVVEVRVARRDHVEAPDAERRERGHDHTAPEVGAVRQRRPAVDEERAAPALHDDRVALAYVEQRGPFGEVRWSRSNSRERRGRGDTGFEPDTKARKPAKT